MKVWVSTGRWPEWPWQWTLMREAMAPRWMRLYRRTTWGRMCREWEGRGFDGAEPAFLEGFCAAVLSAD